MNPNSLVFLYVEVFVFDCISCFVDVDCSCVNPERYFVASWLSLYVSILYSATP